jgi:hypothetical protein
MPTGQTFNLLPLIGGILFTLIAMFGVTGLWKRTVLGRKLLRPTKRSPLRDNLLRSPWQTLQDELLDKTIDFALDACSFGFLIIVAVIFVPLLLGWQLLTLLIWLILGAFVVWILYKLRKISKQIRDKRVGLDGELATAEELNQLMHDGYYVFHDFPASKFNIDHIVIGPAGVLAVETKSRAKPVGKEKRNFTVTFENARLIFPNFQDSEAIQQAKDQAKWLSDFLRKSVGKGVAVKPVLALPGWMVKSRTRDASILVINPGQAVARITSNTKVLDQQTIQQIKYQVEQKCRTIKPYEPV